MTQHWRKRTRGELSAIRAHSGRRGGLADSPAQFLQRRYNILRINEARRSAKRQALEEARQRDVERNIEAREPPIIRPQMKMPSYGWGPKFVK